MPGRCIHSTSPKHWWTARRVHRRLRIEELEPRIAPVAMVWDEVGTNSASLGGISHNNGDSYAPVIGRDSAGRLIVVWSDESPGNAEIYARYWDGLSWMEFMDGTQGSATGGGISRTPQGQSRAPAMVIGRDGYPIIAWMDNSTIGNTEGDYEIYVKRWNGYSWVEYFPAGSTIGSASGGGISNNTGSSEHPAIALATDGQPIIAWMDNSGGRWQIYVRHWNALEQIWEEMGSGSASGGGISNTPSGGTAGYPTLAVATNDDRPVVAWMERSSASGGDWEIYAKTFNGSSWIALGDSASGGGISNNTGDSMYPKMSILPADGRPMIVWDDNSDGGPAEIYFKLWNGTSWVGMTGDSAGDRISDTPDTASWWPAIMADTDGNPVVAWQEYKGTIDSDIYVKRWDGMSAVWVEYVDALGRGSASGNGINNPNDLYSGGYSSEHPFRTGTYSVGRIVSLFTDVLGNPTVAWQELDWDGANIDFDIYVRRYGPDQTGPWVSAVNTPAVTAGTPVYIFTVEYSDNVAVLWESLDSNDIRVTAPNGYNQLAELIGTNPSTDGTPIVATYQITAPVDYAGRPRWGAPDNDTYTIWLEANQVRDTSDNYALPRAIGTFVVNCESIPPTASVEALQAVTTGTGTFYDFAVTYGDNVAIFVADLDNLDIRVTGPGGYDQLATLENVNNPTDGAPRIATYRIIPPGGTWTRDDEGTYTIWIEANQVSDTSKNYVEAGTLESFIVDFEDVAPTAVLNTGGGPVGGSATYEFTVTYSDNAGILVASIDSNDLRVTGPNSFDQMAELVSVNIPTNGSPRIATYRIYAPDGSWGGPDNGFYTVIMQPQQVSDTSENYVATGSIGSFQVNIETQPPIGTLYATNITVGGAATYEFTVVFTDDVAVYAASLTNNSNAIRVIGPGGYNELATFISIDSTSNGPSRTVTYQIPAPGGIWGSPDNGTYTVWVEPNQVRDTNKNFMTAQALGTFDANLETTPPTAALTAGNITTGGGTTYTFTVTYTDNVAIWVGSIDDYDIRVTGPNAYNQLATLISVNDDTNGTPRVATYQITAPGGMWGSPDNGTYIVWMEANQVMDTSENFVGAGSLGSFIVNLETVRPTASGTFTGITSGAGTTYEFAITYGDNVGIFTPSIGDGDVRVTGPNAFNQLATLVSVNDPSNGTPRIATYRITAPGGTWNKADEGTYTVWMEANQVMDTSENYVLGGTLGTFVVALETNPPTAILSASNITVGGATTYGFAIQFSDDVAMLASSINGNNNAVRVTGPGGYNVLATFVSMDVTTNGTPRTAYYSIPAPGGRWGSSDNGPYYVGIEPNQICDTSENYVSGSVGGFTANMETTPPTAVASATNVTAGGGTTYTFSVTYTDATAVWVATIDSNDILVTGPNSFSEVATLVSVNNPIDGSPRTATYRINAPGGVWNAADNGTYTVAILANQVADVNENYIPAGTLTTFTVNIEAIPPTATLNATNITTGGASTYTFRVQFTDNVGIAVSSIIGNNNAIRVTGPNSYNALATYLSIDFDTNGSPRTATYSIPAPGPDGLWGSSDNGTYLVWIEPNQVKDVNENFVVGGTLGSFQANMETAPPTATPDAPNVTTAGSATYEFRVIYADSSGVVVSSIGPNDVRVTGPNSFTQIATFVSVDNPTDGTPRIATYRINAPGGAWDVGDNGVYTIWIQDNEVKDINQNYIPAGSIGGFQVALETNPPTTSLNAQPITVSGGTTYGFAVTYIDTSGILTSTLINNSNVIRVTGPNNFVVMATYMEINNPANGSPRTVTYRIDAPGGTWDHTDSGTYTVYILGNQVSDINGNFVPAGTVGTFIVDIPQIALISGKAVTFEDADGSIITVLLTGPGSGEVTLLNGLTTGDAINQILLRNTTQQTNLKIQSKETLNSTPGTTFLELRIDNASGSLGALGTFSAKGIGLAAGGQIIADGNVKSLVLGNVGRGASIEISGALDSITAGVIAEDCELYVAGNLGNFTADSVGTGSQINVAGNIKQVKTLRGAFVANIIADSLGALSVSTGGMKGNVSANGAGGIGTVAITGGYEGVISAAHAGIKSLQLLGGVVNAEINAKTDIGTLKIAGVGNAQSLKILAGGILKSATLGGVGNASASYVGLIDVKSLGTLAGASADLGVGRGADGILGPDESFTIYARDSIGSVTARNMGGVRISAGSIGTLNVVKNMYQTTVGAGYGIGTDYQWGGTDDLYPFGNASGSIRSITVGGDMTGCSIAAGVSPNLGGDGLYGGSDKIYLNGQWGTPTDDFVIRRLTLKGEIGSVKVGGRILGDPLTTPYAPGAGCIEAAGKIGFVQDVTAKTINPKHVIFGGIVIRSFL